MFFVKEEIELIAERNRSEQYCNVTGHKNIFQKIWVTHLRYIPASKYQDYFFETWRYKHPFNKYRIFTFISTYFIYQWKDILSKVFKINISSRACWIYKADTCFIVPEWRRGSSENKREWHNVPLFICKVGVLYINH